MQASHFALLPSGRCNRAVRWQRAVPNNGRGIPSGSKTAPEMGIEEEINKGKKKKICLEADVAAWGSRLPPKQHSASSLRSQAVGPILPVHPVALWGGFGGVQSY